MMRTFSRSAAAIACAAALFTTSACQDSDPQPSPEPTETTTSATPTPTKPAWESKYTPEQLKAYETALARFTEYEQRAEPIWARGKVTPGAEALFKEYWAAWPNTLNTLRFYEQVGDRIVGLPTVIWSRPSKVTTHELGATVTIQQCIDPSTIEVKHAPGAKVQEKKQGPYIRTIVLDQGGSRPFLISNLIDVTSGKKVKPCGT